MPDDNKNIKMIGKRIREIRKKENMTLEEFGKLFSPMADKAVVSNWENGKNLPNSERIKKIAEIGGVSELYLMTGVDSSVTESMYFLSEVALDSLEHLSSEEVNRIIKSFATYLNAISKIDNPDVKKISLNLIGLIQFLLTGEKGNRELSPTELFELKSVIDHSLNEIVKKHLS